jgi:hypothetical protein
MVAVLEHPRVAECPLRRIAGENSTRVSFFRRLLG